MSKYAATAAVLLILICSWDPAWGQEENIALGKQVVGSFQNLKLITDGTISQDNYGEIREFKEQENFFILVLGQAKYIKGIKLYWAKGYEPLSYRIESSKNLFVWEKAKTYTPSRFSEEKNMSVSSHELDGTAAYFVKITVLKPGNKTVRISETALYPSTTLKLTIQSVSAANIMEHSAEVIFKTSIPSVAYIRFGEDKTGLNQNIGIESDIYDTHKITVSGLLKGTEYYFQPVARDLNGHLAMGQVTSFKTKGIPLPKMESVQLNKITGFGCSMKLVYNIPCGIVLYIGKEKANLVKKFESSGLKTSYKIQIDGLVPETKFYYKIEAADKQKNPLDTENSFTTTGDNIALNKSVYGSFYYPADNNASSLMNMDQLKKLTDGNYELNGIAESGNVALKGQAVILDLGKTEKIRNVKTVWRGTAYSRNYSLEISKDMKEWSMVRDKIDARNDGQKILSQGDYGLFLRTVNISCNNQEGRYIKITMVQNSLTGSDLPFPAKPFLQMAEVEVYKVPDYNEPAYRVQEIK
ncbi:MAG: discoidin domain-containing protein [bacterium]|nr:discoidin domain-containing protein [bacterium]